MIVWSWLWLSSTPVSDTVKLVLPSVPVCRIVPESRLSNSVPPDPRSKFPPVEPTTLKVVSVIDIFVP